MRDVDELIESAQQVLEQAYLRGAWHCVPLLSGGHDSLCATHLASQHRSFRGEVHHIDTGIGAEYTRRFVERVCDRFGWELRVHKSKSTYEKFVAKFGFPGPGAHHIVYNCLKERCVRKLAKGRAWKMLVNGARSQESVRRMGNVGAVQIGRFDKRAQKVVEHSRVWTAPCHDWSKAEQALYMDEFGLPVNKLKVALGLSGECFCGAFAAPGEREAIREHAPDVSRKIDELTCLAKKCGTPCEWGQRPKGKVIVAEAGPMCSSCDQRAAASGVVVIDS